MSKTSSLGDAAASCSVMAKLTELEAAMLEKLVGDEMIRARESGWSSDHLDDLATLRDTLETADVLHVEMFRITRPMTKRGRK